MWQNKEEAPTHVEARRHSEDQIIGRPMITLIESVIHNTIFMEATHTPAPHLEATHSPAPHTHHFMIALTTLEEMVWTEVKKEGGLGQTRTSEEPEKQIEIFNQGEDITQQEVVDASGGLSTGTT